MRVSSGAAAALVALTMTSPTRHERPTMIQVAPGILLFRTPDYGDVGLDGNAVAILSGDGVLVFDSNGTPAAAEAVLAEIRKATDQPVRYLVNSHWHWDHWYGNEVYRRAFPDVRIIAHEKTRELMMGPALAFNRPGLETGLPGYIQALAAKAEATRAATPSSPALAELERRLEEDRFFLEQKKSVRFTFPDVTFTDRMTLYLGGRQIQLLHRERAVTPGDAFLYLPAERIVVTGDLLVNPISFALSCYPSGWLKTLEWIDALDVSLIVPGPGDPLHDKVLLHATMDVFRELLRQGRELRARGLDADEARDAILPGLHGLRSTMTHDDPALNEAFRVQLVDWFLHRVYDELAGPLSDEIAPIPRR
jgi:cyclase